MRGGGGRKNLKRAIEEENFTLEQGQSIVQVVDLRGSNLIQVLDAKGENSLAIFPAKFQKSMWIKRGNFVVVDESGREEAVESGRKVGCIVTKVLYYEQVRVLQKSAEWKRVKIQVRPYLTVPSFDICKRVRLWRQCALSERPEIFKFIAVESSKQDLVSQIEEDENSSDDDGLPPLEANTNRLNPIQLETETESDSDTDS